MLNRRSLLGAAAGGAAALATGPAFSQADWRTRFPELVFAIIPFENAASVNERFNDFIAYLSRELRVRVTLRIVADYAAVIEGQRAGHIHIGVYGPSSFARALQLDVPITAIVQDVNADGSTGNYSVFLVKAGSPYRNLEDLRGKVLGLVDPNSATGNNVPRYELHKLNIVPERYFSRVIYTGSHENAVFALQQGQIDVAANWWNNDNESNLTRMARRNMIKVEDFRIVFRSAEILNAPTAVLNALGPDGIRDVQRAFLEAHVKDKAAFDRMAAGAMSPFRPITNADYQPMVELNRFVDGLRRRT